MVPTHMKGSPGKSQWATIYVASTWTTAPCTQAIASPSVAALQMHSDSCRLHCRQCVGHPVFSVCPCAADRTYCTWRLSLWHPF